MNCSQPLYRGNRVQTRAAERHSFFDAFFGTRYLDRSAMLCKLLLVAMLAAGAEALRFAARPTATRTSAAVTMSEMSRRGAHVAAAVLASGGTPAHASDLASKVRSDASQQRRSGLVHGRGRSHSRNASCVMLRARATLFEAQAPWR